MRQIFKFDNKELIKTMKIHRIRLCPHPLGIAKVYANAKFKA